METKKEVKRVKKEQRDNERAEREKQYNLAKTWQLVLFPANSVANVLFMMLMMSVSYYAAGVVGLGTVIASMVITGSRVFDAITDPMVGFFLDRLNGKFGKIRPFFIIGYLLMSVSTIVMFFSAHHVHESIRLLYFIMLYALYILGYTFTGVAGNAAQPILTNDPKQRPLLGGIASLYNYVFATIMGMLTPLYLVPKYGGFNNAGLFQELVIIVVIAAGVFYSLAIIGIWSKDRVENFGVGNVKAIKVNDILPILKSNRPLQLFVFAGLADKLATTIATNSVIGIMLYGIIIGDYSLSGYISPLTLIVSVIAVIVAVRIGGKTGLRKGYVGALWGCIIFKIGLFFLLWFGEPTQIGFDQIGFMTIAFLILTILSAGFDTAGNTLCSPMLSDITDYETYRSGRFVPGTLATVYSLIDKMVSSAAPMIVGLVVAAIGFKEAFPDIDTPYSEKIFWSTMILAYGTVILAWIISLIAMKFYPLTKEKMEEIQVEIRDRRSNIDINEQQELL